MKKSAVLLFIMFMITGCIRSDNDVPKYTYEIQAERVDMSGYKGVSSTNHKFLSTTVSELCNVLDNDSSAVFYLGRDNCGCCQSVCRYLDEVARELDVTVYYLDVYNEKEPLTEAVYQDMLRDAIYDILAEDDDGEKVLLTPHVFSIVNGRFHESLICYDGIDFSDEPTDKQIETLKNVYRSIMRPFASNKSD